MAETFEDELDAHIMECMKEPEYWAAHMASCIDPECKFHIPDPRWKHVHGYIGPPEISFEELSAGIDPNDFVEFWLEVSDGNFWHYRKQLVTKEMIKDIVNQKVLIEFLFNHMIEDIDKHMGTKEEYER